MQSVDPHLSASYKKTLRTNSRETLNLQASNITPDNVLIRTAYSSIARAGATMSVLENILEVSRANNKANGVTGVLVFSKNKFLQVLEGDAKQVNALINKIKDDHRHERVDILFVENIKTKIFSEWSMGFIGENTPSHEFDNLPAIDTIIKKIKNDSSYANSFLKGCRDMLLVS